MANAKNTFFILLVIAVGILLVGFIIPAGIKLFFAGLLWMFKNPGTALAISIAFLAGTALANISSKQNK